MLDLNVGTDIPLNLVVNRKGFMVTAYYKHEYEGLFNKIRKYFHVEFETDKGMISNQLFSRLCVFEIDL